MIPLGMELASSQRLSQTTLVSGTVWPQFAMQVLTGGYQPPIWRRGGRMGLEIDSISGPGSTP